MSSLLTEMERVIASVDTLNRRKAYAELEAVFGGLKASCDTLCEAETSEFIELVHLILLQFPRGETIRVSGPHQARELDVCLKYSDAYEAALSRAMEFLSRNLLDHIEKYSPRQYLRAALRALGKEYYRALVDSYRTDSIPEETAAPSEDEPGATASVISEECLAGDETRCAEALTVVGPDQPDNHGDLPESVSGPEVEQQMFQNWHEGNLSRLELTRLYGFTMDRVNQALLHIARLYADGRYYGVLRWLIEMGEDGDIIWLLSKDMTAADVGQKVHRNQWVVYKHRDAVLRQFQGLRQRGDEGRAFCAAAFGLRPHPSCGRQISKATRDCAAKVGLSAPGAEAQAPPG